MKTQKDLFVVMLEMVGEKAKPGHGQEYAKVMMSIFEPRLKKDFANEELTDEQFQKQLDGMRAELPAFLQHLESLPPSTPTNN